jgi:gliding motility-associated-like protein
MTVTSSFAAACSPIATAIYTITVNPLPTATAGGVQTICSNETATVNGASSSNGSILWTENGAGNIINGQGTLSPTYAAAIGDAGNTVTLTMTVSSSYTPACSPPATATYTIIVNPLPTATAGGSQTICSNTSATVSGASAANGIIFWTHNGAGNISNGQGTTTPTYTASASDAGSQVILTMTVTSSFIPACSLSLTATASYTITVNPLPIATAGGVQTICSNETATVSGASSLNGFILWTENGSGNITNGQGTLSPTYTAAIGDAGNTVTLTMTVSSTFTPACIPAATATYIIIVNPIPTATSGGSQTICSNSSATISGASSSNGTILWTSNGAGAITNASTLSPTYTANASDAGSQVILTMTVTSSFTPACTSLAIATYTITVNPIPTATAGGVQTICSNATATVSEASFSNGSILWTENGAGNITNGQGTVSPTYTAAAGDEGNTVVLTMTVTSSFTPECIPPAIATYNVIVIPIPNAQFSYSDSLGCDVLDVTYTAVSSNPTWDYFWDFGNGVTTQQASSIGYQFDLEGCYDVSLTVTNNNGCTATQLYTDIACVYDNPIASFSTDQDVLNEIDPLVSFYNNSINANSFEWEFGDGTNSFSENPIHTYPDDAASYLVTLVAYNEISCTDSASIRIIILKDVGLYVPNSFTPDGDEYNHTFYPILTEGFKKDSYHMSIFDRWGEIVFETYDPSFGWNGTYKNGIQCQIGTYTWVIEVIELQSAVNRKFNGHVNLIR